MTHIEELIQELCPEGIEHVALDEVVKIRNGSDYKALGAGEVPVYGSGGIMTTVDTAVHGGPSVLIPRKGSLGNLFYVDQPFWTVDTIFYTEIDLTRLMPKFFYYSMYKHRLAEKNQAGGVPSMTQSYLKKLRIPVPPLEVQREIVRVLDKFTQLEAELEAELEARRAQYNHYRHEAFSFGSEVETRPLGELAWNLDNRRKPVTRDARKPGNIPYYGASGVVDYVSGYIFDGDYLLVSEDGANLLARSTPIAFSVSGKTWVNNHAHVLQFDTYVERRFVEIYLNSIDLAPFISGSTQPKLNKANLNRIPIPAPSLEVKERVVDILDKFDALVNDISVGLPAELAARRKQYEHYRDRLLTFKELAA
ncbi:restriction endonuclease subunit S [Nocardia sp. CC227C]|uniref:restriction endonuclease subunit S n=1 Tax=Nocardia sp. CC227C TaxID=3044562 RepID=UPI00278C1911|nr:restriction endonuclease subunit S [Nocardia sp. CC227C]